MNTLAKNIRMLRKQNGMTQDELATKLNKKSYTTVQKWESGVSEPSVSDTMRIAELFGVSMADLVGEDMSNDTYYLDDDARDLAQFLFENPEYRILFDASRKVKREDIQFIKDMMDRMIGND